MLSHLSVSIIALAAPALAHVELRATLDGAQEVPAVTTSATGSAEMELVGTSLEYTVTHSGLSGPVLGAHLHAAPRGESNPIPLVALDQNTLTGTLTLTEEQIAQVFAGDLYVNLHTASNLGGEIRGQIELPSIAGVTCPCSTATKVKEFRQCVAKSIKGLDPEDKKSAGTKALKRAVKRSSCGKSKGPKKAVGCCMPYTPEANVVIERLCAPIPAKACDKIAGSLQQTSCFDNERCSPSGAFVDGPSLP